MIPEKFESLKANILKNGQHESIKLLNGIIIDGRNRFLACQQLGIQPKFETWTGDTDSLDYVISINQERRNLNESQLALAAAEYATLPKGANQHTAAAACSQKLLAKRYGISTDSIQRAKKVLTCGDQAIIDLVKRGELAVSMAAELCASGSSKKKQLPALKKKEREIVDAAAVIKAKERNLTRAKRVEGMLARIANAKCSSALPQGPFSLIYADPPWRYSESTDSGSRLYIENHYDTMATDDICKMDVASICDKDSMLFMWTPSSLLLDALRVMTSWGFTYKSQAVWAKKGGPTPYLGSDFFQCHETLIYGYKTGGNGLPAPKPENKSVSVFEAPRTKHSKKPELVYDVLEKMYPEFKTNFCELFARNTHPGWASWGNEAGDADAA